MYVVTAAGPSVWSRYECGGHVHPADVGRFRGVRDASDPRGPVVEAVTPSGGGGGAGGAVVQDGGSGARWELPNGLVAAAVRDDGRARDDLLALIHPLVLRYCRGRMGRQQSVLGAADDVAQDVCLAVLAVLPT